MTKPTRWEASEWEQATFALLRRCGGRCEVCGKDMAGRGVRHHRQRRREGGDRLCNLLLIHSHCHAYVHGHPNAARANGWIVSVYAEPDEAPVLVSGRWWTLTDDGERLVYSGAHDTP